MDIEYAGLLSQVLLSEELRQQRCRLEYDLASELGAALIWGRIGGVPAFGADNPTVRIERAAESVDSHICQMAQAVSEMVFRGELFVSVHELTTRLLELSSLVSGATYTQLCELVGMVCKHTFGLAQVGASGGRDARDFGDDREVMHADIPVKLDIAEVIERVGDRDFVQGAVDTVAEVGIELAH